MATATQDLTEKIEVNEIASIDKGTPQGNLTFLAQAAATEHALTPLQAIRTYWRAFLWCMFMCIGALLWGYDAQVGGGLLSVPQFRTDFGYVSDNQPILPASWQSAFNSVSSIGGMFGGLSLGWISDRLGRRGAVAVACAISIVGVLIQFLTPTHANGMLLVGKLINGFALGMYVSCAGGYCAEVSPLALRGITTAAVNLWIDHVIFNSMSNGVIRGTGNRTDVYAYRLPFALQWIFPVILLIGLPFAPESPWWLVRKGRYEDAEKVLVRLGGPTVDAKVQQQQIKETIELEDAYAATATYVDCFRGENLKRTIVAMMVFVLQQGAGEEQRGRAPISVDRTIFLGVVFVLGFSTYFFELAGFATSNAFNLGVGVTAIGVVGNLLTFYTVNRYGRRFIFNWGMVACTVILLLIGFIWIGNTNQNAKWAVSAFTIIYNFVYQTSIGPLGYVIFAEVSSAKLRSKTVGIGIWTNSLCGMIANIVIPYLVNPDEANLGGYVGFIFGGLAFAGTIWAYFFIPETRGRTVDELDLLYEKRVPARHFGAYKLYDEDTDAT
ncbi:general substrate transporter [Lanmaoa asiatica]|nr:general substrate transporter [Lanmaoa asiatica]